MLIEIDLDGYETQEEMFEACKEFVLEELNITASGVSILWAEEPEKQKPLTQIQEEELERLKKQLGSMDKFATMLKNDKEYIEEEIEAGTVLTERQASQKGFGDWLPGGDVQMRGPH